MFNWLSNIGVDKLDPEDLYEKKILVFFNRALCIGMLSSCLQFILMIAWMPGNAIWFGLLFVEILLCLFFNKIGYFNISKRIILFTVLIQGFVLVNLLHGKYHFHFSTICIFTFALVILDLRKNLIELILIGLASIAIIIVGEKNDYGIEVLDGKYDHTLRYINLLSAFLINSFFMIFILRLNNSYHRKLRRSITERDELVREIEEKKNQLQEQKNHLEELVAIRTERLKVQRDELIVQNEEKEILLKEVHHRVKNNLQIIISLINLQINKIDSSNGAVEHLREIQSRVHSMSLVHKKMYLNPSMSNVNLEEYVAKLVEQINEFQSNEEYDHSISIPEDISIPLDEAISLGLIINEILTNFHKHVIPSRENAQFDISVHPQSKNHFELMYQDNGEGFDIKAFEESTGLQILEGLVEQLDGELLFDGTNGTNYRIRFGVGE